ncbi:MAG: hypothetical protein GY797_24885, partial [Deltaproteobacteria bacterium]|nr:hypothetical protein [Deltaproteobacteria bacterium]
DELGDAARFATKHSDELADAVTWSARHGDDLSEARLAQRLDDYASPNGAAARLGNETLENRRLERRLGIDNGRSNSFAYESWDPNYKPRREALSQEEIYDKIAQSETGQYILEQVDQIGELPIIKFTNEKLEPRSAAAYFPIENEIRIRPEIQDLPDEVILSTVSHELVHRTHRQLAGSLNSEVYAHYVEANVWRQLGGEEVVQNLDLSGLTNKQRAYMKSQQIELSKIRTVEEMQQYLYPKYSQLPDYSVTHIESYERDIQIWEGNRAYAPDPSIDYKSYKDYNSFVDRKIAEIQKQIGFWESFSE